MAAMNVCDNVTLNGVIVFISIDVPAGADSSPVVLYVNFKYEFVASTMGSQQLRRLL